MIPDYAILHEYIYSLKYKAPYNPEALIMNDYKEDGNQENEVSLSVQAQESGIFYVDLIINIQGKAGRKKMFGMELIYRGVVFIKMPQPDEVISHYLNVEAPAELYSSAQDAILDITSYSGLQAIELDPIDFNSQAALQ